jgi:hypothetical protein
VADIEAQYVKTISIPVKKISEMRGE